MLKKPSWKASLTRPSGLRGRSQASKLVFSRPHSPKRGGQGSQASKFGFVRPSGL